MDAMIRAITTYSSTGELAHRKSLLPMRIAIAPSIKKRASRLAAITANSLLREY